MKTYQGTNALSYLQERQLHREVWRYDTQHKDTHHNDIQHNSK